MKTKSLVVEYKTAGAILPLAYKREFGKMAICATKHLHLIKEEEMKRRAEELIALIKKLK